MEFQSYKLFQSYYCRPNNIAATNRGTNNIVGIADVFLFLTYLATSTNNLVLGTRKAIQNDWTDTWAPVYRAYS
jgi:hypothetical protein